MYSIEYINLRESVTELEKLSHRIEVYVKLSSTNLKNIIPSNTQEKGKTYTYGIFPESLQYTGTGI